MGGRWKRVAGCNLNTILFLSMHQAVCWKWRNWKRWLPRLFLGGDATHAKCLPSLVTPKKRRGQSEVGWSDRGERSRRVSANEQNRTNLHRGRSGGSSFYPLVRLLSLRPHARLVNYRGQFETRPPNSTDERANFQPRRTKLEEKWFTRATSTRPDGPTRGLSSPPTASRSV